MDAILDSVLPKIRQRIHINLAEHHVPGAAVAIVRDQELAWAEGFGLADIASKRVMTPDTLFGVASISKTSYLRRRSCSCATRGNSRSTIRC